MTPTEAFTLCSEQCLRTIPRERLDEYRSAIEILRRLVVDDIARKKNSADTQRLTRSDS
jgi:hypothetical protein